MREMFPIEADTIQTVSEITKEIKILLEPNFKNLWVKGEISNLRIQHSGHCYFSLKDSNSQIPCVFFSRYANACDFALEEGMEIVVFGDLSLYEPYGRYQMSIKMAQKSGQGNLHLLFEKLKDQLKKEGLFDTVHKKLIPKLPKNIALITSPTGAAIKDFMRILRRRGFSGSIDLIPAKVQGKTAYKEIIEAVEYVAQKENHYDLLVVTRGGGSIEDLWTFNEEALARSLFQCPVPIISAVGHEIDTVLTDLVADYRAETPSGAAEFISSNYLTTNEAFKNLKNTIISIIKDTFKVQNLNLLNDSKSLALLTPQHSIDKKSIQLDVFEKKLSHKLNTSISEKRSACSGRLSRLARQHPMHYLKSQDSQLRIREHQLDQLVDSSFKVKQAKFSNLNRRLENSSIQSSLKRGFVILKDPSNDVLGSLSSAVAQKNIKACFYDGEIELENKKVNLNGRKE